MIYSDFDLKQRRKGEIIQVTLTGGANVLLMDETNLSLYKSGKKHRYYGGLATRSPYNLAIPEAGNWHVIINLKGLGNNTAATVKALSDSKPIIGKICELAE